MPAMPAGCWASGLLMPRVKTLNDQINNYKQLAVSRGAVHCTVLIAIVISLHYSYLEVKFHAINLDFINSSKFFRFESCSEGPQDGLVDA